MLLIFHALGMFLSYSNYPVSSPTLNQHYRHPHNRYDGPSPSNAPSPLSLANARPPERVFSEPVNIRESYTTEHVFT
jgi:hypothetical protein